MSPAYITEALRDVKRLDQSGHRIRVEMLPSEAIQLVALVQFAARHPANDGPAFEFGRRVVSTVQKDFRSAGSEMLHRLIADGWNEEHYG